MPNWFHARGIEPDELVSVGRKKEAGGLRWDVMPMRDAIPLVESLSEQDCWVGVNPLREGVPAGKRGTAEDVTRLTAVWVDLDVKDGGMPSWEAAWDVITILSHILGRRPVAVVMRGHGFHAYWGIELEEGVTTFDGPNDPARKRAISDLKRWGRLVQVVANRCGGQVDSVFDLSRVLRPPETTNCKDIPVRTTAELPGGSLLSLEGLEDVLDAYGIEEDSPVQHEARESIGVPYSDLPPSLRARIDSYVDVIRDGLHEDAKALAALPEGERIDELPFTGVLGEPVGWEAGLGKHLIQRALRLNVAACYRGDVDFIDPIREACQDDDWHRIIAEKVRSKAAWARDMGPEEPSWLADALANSAAGALDQVSKEPRPTGDAKSAVSPDVGLLVGGAHDAAPEQALEFENAVETEVRRLRVRKTAAERFRIESEPPAPPFDAGRLVDLLDRPVEPPARIEGLIPWEAGTLVVAQRKTGKTTFDLNLARSLITGEAFLGRFGVIPLEEGRSVAILNYEVSAAMIARWAADLAIPHDRLFIVTLRGRRNPLSHPQDRADLAAVLGAHNVETLIVDPFGAAYTGKSQNDPGEVQAWLADLDRFARGDVGARDVVLSAHAGWNGEHARGASSLEGWPDVVITLTREEGQGNRPRYMRAEGRDVAVEEDQLAYNSTTRELTLAGVGSRKQASLHRKLPELAVLVEKAAHEQPGISSTDLRKVVRAMPEAPSFADSDVDKAARHAQDHGHLLIQREGPGKPTRHYATKSWRKGPSQSSGQPTLATLADHG